MSTPVNFRLPLNVTGKAEPEVVEALGWHDDAINDLQQAIPSLKNQITALQKATTGTGTGTSTTTNVTEESASTNIVTQNNIGMVNAQTGTTYFTQQSDYGAFLQISNAGAVAVTLSTGPAIQTPWYVILQNFGVGTITCTPQTGTINGGGSFAVAQNQSALICFDGTNFEASLIPVAPQNTPAVAGQYLTGYSGSTGSFSSSTPAGISVTITTAKLTAGGANGSMTFTGGLLTSQVAAT